MSEYSRFLSTRYPELAGSRPVIRAVEQAKQKDQETPHTKEDRIAAYLNRLDTLFSEPRSFGLLKHKLFERYVTKPDDIPESYWKLQEQITRERGQAGDWERASDEEKAEVKRQTVEGVLSDQQASLEQWIDYLASADSQIPKDIKYWIFRSILGLTEYDKEKKEFPRRSRGTVKQFPDINYEALGYVVDSLGKKFQGTELEFEYDIQADERVAFQQALDKKDFAKLYAWANELHNPIPEHLLAVTDGEWRLYQQGGDARLLSQSIRGKGTGWCTAGEQTATKQLEGGDFHVFYSLDDEGKPTIPRIAIREENGKIVEVRGVAFKQNLDSYMPPVLAEKLKDFPDGDQYLKKDADMQRLTQIEAKTKKKEPLTKEDLTFLYEIDSPIEGFGYRKDPRIVELLQGRDTEEDIKILCGYDVRNPDEEALKFIYARGSVSIPQALTNVIKELRKKRDWFDDFEKLYGYNLRKPDKEALAFIYKKGTLGITHTFQDVLKEFFKGRSVKEDVLIVFDYDYTPDQVAQELSEVNENTKVYVGPWNPKIYQALRPYLSQIDHLHTSLLEHEILAYALETDPTINTPEKALKAFRDKQIYMHSLDQALLKQIVFSKEPQTYQLVEFTPADLGFSRGASFKEVVEKAKSFGLELCPPEVGPRLRLRYLGTDYLTIAMEPIAEPGRSSRGVFKLLGRNNHDLSLDVTWEYSSQNNITFGSGSRIVFLAHQ